MRGPAPPWAAWARGIPCLLLAVLIVVGILIRLQVEQSPRTPGGARRTTGPGWLGPVPLRSRHPCHRSPSRTPSTPERRRRAPGQIAAVVQAPPDGAVLTFPMWEDVASALDRACAILPTCSPGARAG